MPDGRAALDGVVTAGAASRIAAGAISRQTLQVICAHNLGYWFPNNWENRYG